jgi:HSP20 family protein
LLPETLAFPAIDEETITTQIWMSTEERMADQKTNRSDSSREGGQALASRDREQGTMQRRSTTGGWMSNPFEVMDRMTDAMDRTFDQVFRDFGMPRRSWLARSPFRSGEREGLWSPRVEAIQKGDQFIVRADLPGLKKDDVQVDLTDDAITIRGERHDEHQEEREGYYHSEREYGQFSRTIPLPEGVIGESAQASFRNGVLEITMQAPPEATRGRRLEIKDTSESGDKK